MGVHCYQPGPCRSLETAQCHRGFAHVEERVLECFLDHKGATIPTQEDKDIDRATELKMAAIKAAEPKWDSRKVAEALNRCFLIENPDFGKEAKVPTNLLREVVAATEAKDMGTKVAARSQLQLKKMHMVETRDACMKKYFKVHPPTKWRPCEKARLRWWPEKDESAPTVSNWMMKQMPDLVRIFTDIPNGRFRLIGPAGSLKSISWTKRGMKAAALECLLSAWGYYTDSTGEKPPLDMGELQNDLTHELDAILA